MDKLKLLIEESAIGFKKYFSFSPVLVSAAPGRINIIGEHTDYNIGLSMPAAINRWIFVTIAPRKDNICLISSKDFNSRMEFELGKDYIPSESWQKYVYGAISVVNNQFEFPCGFNAVISGNVPIGSGVSSSGALEVALINAFRSLYTLSFDDKQLIRLCQRVEHDYLLVQSGLLDQFASQFSRRGQLMIIDFKSLTCDFFNAFMDGFSWVVVDSGVKREIAFSKYMERVQECKDGLINLKKSGLPVKDFRDITRDHLQYLEGNIYRRLLHYVNENLRVLAVKDSILQHDFFHVGNLLNQSHQSLRMDYEVSCSELDFLVETAIRFPGCVGARMMGGGFGGCTLNLVQDAAVSEFIKKIPEQYTYQFPHEVRVYQFNLVDGAGVSFTDNMSLK